MMSVDEHYNWPTKGENQNSEEVKKTGEKSERVR